MLIISRLNGDWNKPDVVPVKNDAITVIGGCVLYTIFIMAHLYIKAYIKGNKLI